MNEMDEWMKVMLSVLLIYRTMKKEHDRRKKSTDIYFLFLVGTRNGLYLYSEVALFESRSRYQLSWMRFFFVFLSPFPIHHSTYHSTESSLHTECLKINHEKFPQLFVILSGDTLTEPRKLKCKSRVTCLMSVVIFKTNSLVTNRKRIS
jgi:hypothetical protein